MRKTDTEQIRIANRKQIIEYLRVHGPIARVDMGHALKLSPATVTAITADLHKEARLIEVQDPTTKTSGRGRPRVLIDLAPSSKYVLGLKLSINELRIMLGNQKGQIVKENIVDLQTLKLSKEGLVEAITSKVRSFSAKLSLSEKPSAIGIAVQGVINGLTGAIIWSPALSEKHVQLKQPLEKALNLPVTVANDANCLAIAIRHQRKYQQLTDFTVVMLGYGVGMGMIVGGELYLGHHGAGAEFGHTKYNPEGAQCLCGKRGCIEAYVGDYALFRDARTIVPLPNEDSLHPTESSMKKLVHMADHGHTEIKELFARAGLVLGFGLSNYIALMSPEKIVISGPGIRAYPHLEQGIHLGLSNSLVKELIAETTIEQVDWNEDMTVLGVIALALQSVD